MFFQSAMKSWLRPLAGRAPSQRQKVTANRRPNWPGDCTILYREKECRQRRSNIIISGSAADRVAEVAYFLSYHYTPSREGRGLNNERRSRQHQGPTAHINCSGKPLFHRKDVDRTALRYVRILSREQQVDARLHLGRVHAPTGLDRDVLLAVNLEGGWHSGHARDGLELPQDFAALGIEGAEHAVIGAAREQHVAAGRQHRTPVERRQVGRPHLLAGVDVPGLQLTDVIGTGDNLQDVLRDAHEALAHDVFGGFARQLRAQVLVGRDVHQPRPRAEGNRRPVLATPQAWAELRGLVDAGLLRFVNVRPPGLGIEALEHILAHIGLAGHEVDLSAGALEVPDVAAARYVDETFHGSSVALIVHDDRRRDLVPVPGVVG